MNKKPQSITFQRAAAELCVSDSTVKRLIRRGTLHTTKPELRDGHWARRIFWDKSFRAERARRLNGLKAPRRKHILDTYSVQKEFERKAREEKMNEICEQWCKDDPSTIQTVTPKQKSELTQAAMLERMENATGICSMAIKNCQDIKDSITRYQHEVDTWAREKVDQITHSELVCTRCTAVSAAACILQLILAVYYTLCHFNII